MDLQLDGKVAAVTGASRGIGLAVTRALADEGVSVAAGARGVSDGLKSLAAERPVRAVAADLTTGAGPGRLIDEALSAFGRLDILVNNVGAAHWRSEGFLAVTDDDWSSALAVNFLAAVGTTRAALPHLLESAGVIVSICSVNAFLPDPAVIDYSASKAALANFSKSLSKEVGPRGVRVNTVSPGPVGTALWLGEDGVAATIAKTQGSDPDAVARQAAGQGATGRFTTPEEVADLVLFLVSDRARNITGSDYVIDGGLVTTL